MSLPGEPLRLRQVGLPVLGRSSLAGDVIHAVNLDTPHGFTFSQASGNLREMRGTWHVAGDTTHCTIDNRVEFEPGIPSPGGLGGAGLPCKRLRYDVAARNRIALVCLMLSLAGCASAPERPAPSTVGCAEAVVAALPAGLTEAEKHCLASAGIAQQCSRFEAWLAGWGKEIQDAVGTGDASWDDLAADRAGRRCASKHAGPDALLDCCRGALAAPRN